MKISFIKYIVFILITIIYSSKVFPQKNYVVTQYSTQNGLPQKTINAMQQDSQGYIWFATKNSISRFDGRTFINYRTQAFDPTNQAGNYIQFFKRNIDGYFWIQDQKQHIYRFNPRTGLSQRIPYNENYKGRIIDILSNGDVWFYKDNGDLYRIYNLHQNLIRIQKITHLSFPVKSIFMDHHKQDIWILTEQELMQYKAATHKIIRHKFKGIESRFYCLRKYPHSYLIGGDNGYLFNYNIKQNTYYNVKLPTPFPIRKIKPFSSTQLLAITDSDGFFLYDIKKNKSIHYSHHTSGLLSDSIKTLYVEPDKNIWLTYNNHSSHISHLFTSSEKIVHYMLKDKNGIDIKQCKTIDIFDNVNNYLLFHSKGHVINYYDKNHNQVKPFILSDNPEIISFNEPDDIYLDKQKNLWLSKQNRGVVKVSFKKDMFQLYSPEAFDLYSKSNEVTSTLEDNKHNLWIGLQDGTIRIYDRHMNQKGYLAPSGKIVSGKKELGVACCMLQDKRGTIWIGTKENGIIELTPNGEYTYHFKQHTFNPNESYSLNDNHIYALHEDNQQNIWIGTFGGGLNLIARNMHNDILFINANNRLKQYPHTAHQIRCINSDINNNIWIGTTYGLIQGKINSCAPEKMEFKFVTNESTGSVDIGSCDVHDIHIKDNEEIYVATNGKGLYKFKAIKGKLEYKNYSKSNGLLSNILLSIQEDVKGNLWVATEEGLCRFFTRNNTFDSYDSRFFPLDIQFTEGSATSGFNGKLLFNTDRGLLSFNPDNIKKDSFCPQISFEQIVVKDHEVIPSKNSQSDYERQEKLSLKLSYDENSFSIHFVALDMKYPDKIQYTYRLKGFDSWNQVGNSQTATYTNVPKGTYTFEVRSTNSDGIWMNNTREIQITVLPSFWESVWGILTIIASLIAIIVTATLILLSFYKLKSEVVLEQRLSDIKTKFFTDIVHELRTPFTLIIAPLEHILSSESLSDSIRNDLKLIQRNTQRTVRLINQILDFQKIKHDKMTLRVQRVSLYDYLKHIVDSFKSLSRNWGTELVFNNSDTLYIWIDTDKMESVIFNLISNAFKYSPKGTKIIITLHDEEQYVALSIKDQGAGITPEKQKLLFNRFESNIHNPILNQSGTGIGLALVKEIVELHKGNITVHSQLNKGTTFTIRLKKGRNHFSKGTEFVLSDYPCSETVEKETLLDEMDDDLAESKNISATILLVEDNQELCNFLQNILTNSFHIITASNGEEGLNKALQFCPDIIISDIVMPVLNGIEMVKKLRTNISICHIPIILLTSQAEMENRISGMELGVDDYITKPFSANYLKARIFNLIEQRKRLQSLYCSQLIQTKRTNTNEDKTPKTATTPTSLLSSYDKELLDHAVTYIKKNIGDESLSVENMAQEIGMSRSTLFKKIKSLTGLSPVELIKNIRIQQAILLMEEGKLNLTQIAYATGFTDSQYFSKSFKQMFGMTPSEYKKQQLTS